MTTGQTRKTPDLIFVTGMSGAGRSTALKVFEDLGYAIIDNLPHFLLDQLHVGLSQGKITLPLVVGFDIQSFKGTSEELQSVVQKFHKDYAVRLLFLECQNEVLLKRYNASRHRHPLGQSTLLEGIEKERVFLEPIKSMADHVIDTSVTSVVTLGRVLKNIFARATSPLLQIRLMSFSYRRGLPPDADMVLDARFLENPHYEEHLQKQTGCDIDVVKFLVRDKSWSPVFESVKEMIKPTITGFKNSGRSYLTIAIGCTGGQHRSVFMIEQLAAYLRELGENIFVEHRELSSK